MTVLSHWKWRSCCNSFCYNKINVGYCSACHLLIVYQLTRRLRRSFLGLLISVIRSCGTLKALCILWAFVSVDETYSVGLARFKRSFRYRIYLNRAKTRFQMINNTKLREVNILTSFPHRQWHVIVNGLLIIVTHRLLRCDWLQVNTNTNTVTRQQYICASRRYKNGGHRLFFELN